MRAFGRWHDNRNTDERGQFGNKRATLGNRTKNKFCNEHQNSRNLQGDTKTDKSRLRTLLHIVHDPYRKCDTCKEDTIEQ